MNLPRPVVRAAIRLIQWLPHRLPVPITVSRRWLDLGSKAVILPRSVSVSWERIGGIRSRRLADRDADPARVVLHLHGGGYTSGSPRTHSPFAAGLSAAAAAVVHLPEYRLAPEHPYPAALEDALRVYCALAEEAGDAGRVVVSGDSAGGGIALALALRLRDLGEPLPAAIVLVCPWLDLTLSGRSLRTNLRRDAGLWSPALRVDAVAYAAGADPRQPELSPLEADLTGFPPIYLQAAAEDGLLDDAERFAPRARDAGVLVEYRRFECLWHDFQMAAGVLADADLAIAEIADALDPIWLSAASVAPRS